MSSDLEIIIAYMQQRPSHWFYGAEIAREIGLSTQKVTKILVNVRMSEEVVIERHRFGCEGHHDSYKYRITP